jgi:hypothetical protein
MWLKLIEQVASTVGWTEVRSPSIANDALPSSAHPIPFFKLKGTYYE